ncbi:hypothetical protein H261_16034 [Paramagnetospirillum caucaseum]|uniref:Uncharacterized protein n=1 Tax=Paramagnetospirillum caucaseum TaxID=1244869 RepID=M2Y768_9PROT|nr:hypothetical protein [Paramagnetospirillum caucaseum]EME68906.1 hypothetical protein H261_16034 [Paramagnetospirillum caucaseum]
MPPMSLLLPDFIAEGLADPKRRRRLGDILVTLVCCLWLGFSTWTFFIADMPDEIFDNHTGKAMQERMKSCEGSFQQRYKCKQALLLNGERWGFAVALDRVLLICAPAITAWLVWGAIKRR